MRKQDLPDSIEARAQRRVRRKMGFYMHALVFVLVNAAIFVYAQMAGHDYRPRLLLGWGLGLLIHGIVTFVSLQGEGLRERMLRQEIERMRRDQKDHDPS
ncbi:MAG: 2TM domain-containing protein [Rhizobacter sp.]|nr:2TM domain-containing protein [Rhizobacter sp.]